MRHAIRSSYRLALWTVVIGGWLPIACGADGGPAASRIAQLDDLGSRSAMASATEAEAARTHVRLPPRADGAIELREGRTGLGLAISLVGAGAAKLRMADGVGHYERGFADDHDVVVRTFPGGLEDYVAFDARPAEEELLYRLDVAQFAGMRLVSNMLEFLDAAGTPRLRMARPYLVGRSGHWRPVAVEVADCAVDRDPRAPWGRAVTPPGRTICHVRLDWSQTQVSYPAIVDPLWSDTGAMTVGRGYHRAVALQDGTALVAGGVTNAVNSNTAELYDPNTDTWAATGDLAADRVEFAMVVLPAPDGRALVIGGKDGVFGHTTATPEAYDPLNGTWAPLPDMVAARRSPTATVLQDGTVLVAGGMVDPRSELFDPSAGQVGEWTATSGTPMAEQRYGQTANELPDGRVLVAGGLGRVGTEIDALQTAEIYDPATQGWELAANMNEERQNHAAQRLPTGEVLVVGGAPCMGCQLGVCGVGGTCRTSQTTEFYDPASDSWTLTRSLATARQTHVLELMPNGWLFTAGGYNCDDGGHCAMQDTAELLDAATISSTAGSWVPLAEPMSTARAHHAAVPLGEGVLVTAGASCYSCFTFLGTAEWFRPQADGEPCHGLPGICRSGFCVDDVCCDGACQDACHACAAAAKEDGPDGSCGSALPGYDPRGECDIEGVATCGETGLCASGGVCAFHPAGATCEPEECSTTARTTWACDGLGTCAADTVSCTPFSFDCDAGYCKSRCETDDDCIIDGQRCELRTGDCVSGATCDGDHTATSETGESFDCTPYKCTADGQCRASCADDAHCVAGYVCDRDQQCVSIPDSSERVVDQGFCAHHAPGRPAARWPIGLLLLGLASVRRRRRSCS